MDEYRPISMISYLYKIISKILTTKLKVVMGDVILEAQRGFIQGKSILNSVLIANETIKWHKKKRKIGAMDFKKGYDSINWYFL